MQNNEKQVQSIFTLNQDGSLSTHIEGPNWNLRNIKQKDTSDYVKLYSDPTVMQSFGDGSVRSEESTKQRINDVWLPRAKKGQPHAAMSVISKDSEFIGHIVAGVGDHEGAAEVGYGYNKKFWGKKIASAVLSTIVEKWAPLVKDIGEGKGEGQFANPIVQQNFCCFMNRRLAQIDATHNLDNTASAKVLSNNGFTAAQYKKSSSYMIDLDGRDFEMNDSKSSMTMEQHIIKNYFDPTSVSAGEILPKNTRYKLIDSNGNEKTISFSDKYNKIKCHVERQVESQR